MYRTEENTVATGVNIAVKRERLKSMSYGLFRGQDDWMLAKNEASIRPP